MGTSLFLILRVVVDSVENNLPSTLTFSSDKRFNKLLFLAFVYPASEFFIYLCFYLRYNKNKKIVNNLKNIKQWYY